MVGLNKTTYRIITLCLSLIFVLNVAAQSEDVRVQGAIYSTDGNIQIHVTVPRGQTVESAILNLDGMTIPLDRDPLPLPVVQWFVIDASDSMINVQSLVVNAIERFVQGVDDTRFGFVVYNSTATVIHPTSQASEVNAILANYNALPNAPGCIGDALAALELDPEAANRILLIAGPLSRQGTCLNDAVQQVGAPVDAIIIADEPDDAYLDITEGSGGTLYRANRNTITTRFNEVKVSWTQPVFMLTGGLPSAPEGRGQLDLTLSTGSQIQLPVTFITRTATESTQTDRPAIEVIATSTLAPTVTPEPTFTPEPTAIIEQPTEEQAVVVEQPTEEEPAVIEQPTEEQAAVVVEQPTEAINASPTPEPPTAEPIVEEAVEEGNQDQTMLFVGLGMIAVGVVLAGAFLFMRGKGSKQTSAIPAPYSSQTFDHTYIEDSHMEQKTQIEDSSPLGFYATNPVGNYGVDQETKTQIYVDDDDDNLLITSVLSDEDFQKMQQRSEGDVIGWLRLNQEPPIDFELRATGATIGRKSTCEINIKGDNAISSEHARLEIRENQTVWVKVLSQTNKVVVNGIILQHGESHQLRPQDVLVITPQTSLIFIARDSDETRL